jgi:hypothetical protein
MRCASVHTPVAIFHHVVGLSTDCDDEILSRRQDG